MLVDASGVRLGSSQYQLVKDGNLSVWRDPRSQGRRDMDAPVLSYTDFKAIQDRRTFMLVQVEEVRGLESPSGDIEVVIAENPPVAFNKATRWHFERECPGVFRWPAGGTALIVDCTDGKRLLLAFHKDKGAPTYAGHDTFPSGLGASDEEVLFPLRTARREAFEEVVLHTPAGLIVPGFEDDCFGFCLEIEAIIKDSRSLYSALKGAALVNTMCRRCPKSARTVTVKWGEN